MRFSRDWLAQYVELPGRAEELADKLTAVGLNVEAIESADGDTVLDVEVTANRPDCMGHLGLAREAAAVLDRPLRRPTIRSAPVVEPERSDSVAVEVVDAEGCPRYSAVVVRGVSVGPSPDWLAKRLEAVGVRPINNVVDITNYVLWEYGQPLHAFDLAKLRDALIRVRRARPGEALETLDGEERRLDENILVIADGGGAVALAGIMGGGESEVSDETSDVLIESAHFSRSRVRRGARQLGMKTDASHRFERGADPAGCLEAALRAAELMAELAGGAVEQTVVDARARELEPISGELALAALNRFGGVEIEADFVERGLTNLGFELETVGDGRWRVTVPSWRRFDFELDPDGEVYPAYFYEEVLRLHGFDPILASVPTVHEPDIGSSAGHRLRERLRAYLSAAGLAETVTYAFYDSAADGRFPGLSKTADPLRLANALSEQYELLRRSMLPNLVAGALFNQRRGAGVVRLFEIGHVFPGAGASEVEALGVILGGTLGRPWEGRRELDFFDLKGTLEGLGASCGLELDFRPREIEGLVAGTGAEIRRGAEVLGYLGQLEDQDAAFPLFVAELAAGELATGWTPSVEAPSRFPGVAMDLTLTHSLEVAWSDLAREVRENRPDELLDFGLKDRYSGAGVPAGAVNTTVFFRYGSGERSLTQEEVNERHHALSAHLEDRFGLSG